MIYTHKKAFNRQICQLVTLGDEMIKDNSDEIKNTAQKKQVYRAIEAKCHKTINNYATKDHK